HGIVEPDGPRISTREPDRVSARRKRGEIALLDRFEMPLRDARLGGQLLQGQPASPAGRLQFAADACSLRPAWCFPPTLTPSRSSPAPGACVTHAAPRTAS